VASATALIYESFSGYSNGNIHGVSVLGTGLAGNWTSTISGNPSGGTATNAMVSSTGLTFGSLPVSGGAVTVSVDSGAADTAGSKYLVLGVNTSTFGTITGTLYSSYLYQANTGYTPANHAIHQRVNSSAAGLNASARFLVNPDNATASTGPGAGYAALGANATASSPTVGETYLAIGRFTNVGGAGGGTATMLTLTLAQYTDWITNQAGDEASLFARAQGLGADEVMVNQSDTSTNTRNFVGGTSTFIQTFTTTNATGGAFSVTYDELRYGTSFADVVPEPGSAALLSLASLGLLRRRRSHLGA